MNIPTPDYTQLPDVVKTAQDTVAAVQLATIRNVQFIIEESGLEPRLNIASGCVDWFVADEPVGASQAQQDNAELMFLDLCTYCRIKQHDQVRAIISNLAKFRAFHPMEEWLETLPDWDDVDRITELIDTVKTENPLWPVYLENWLVQVVEGVCGWRDREEKKPLPHVLTLVGGQGIGKSQWLKALGGRWFKGEAELHLSTSSGKDHQIEALRFPMVELSELNGIFRKADIETLKSFLTREEDAIRAPYERKALVRPRLTSFCGSVNEAEFLNDPSGSRRFWPVAVESIDWSYTVDLDQLWAQAYSFWLDNSGFDLSPEQDALRAQIAATDHAVVSDVEEQIREYLRLHMRNPAFPVLPLSTLDILKLLYGNRARFGNKDKAIARQVIAEICGKHRTIEGKQRSWLLPFNEFAADKATWPDKISLKSRGD